MRSDSSLCNFQGGISEQASGRLVTNVSGSHGRQGTLAEQTAGWRHEASSTGFIFWSVLLHRLSLHLKCSYFGSHCKNPLSNSTWFSFPVRTPTAHFVQLKTFVFFLPCGLFGPASLPLWFSKIKHRGSKNLVEPNLAKIMQVGLCDFQNLKPLGWSVCNLPNQFLLCAESVDGCPISGSLTHFWQSDPFTALAMKIKATVTYSSESVSNLSWMERRVWKLNIRGNHVDYTN